jgi:small-conductance mechanosensitive channel
MNETLAMNKTITINESLMDSFFNQLGVGTTQYTGLEGAAFLAAVVVASVVAAKVIYWVLGKYVKRLTAKTTTDLDDILLKVAHMPIYYLIILFGTEYAVRSVALPAGIEEGVGTLVFIGTIIVGAIFVADLVCLFFLQGVAKKLTAKTKTTADDEAIPFISKIIRFIIYLIALIIVLGQFNIELTPLIASLGIAGFAIGFAAQDTIGNLLAGFFILTDRPFAKGDRIEVKGNLGEVVDIGLRTTKIETLDHTYVIVPNSHIISNEVTNFALPDIQIKVRVNVGVAYGTDPNKVREILVKIASELAQVMKNPPPEAYFIEFGESALSFQLVVWITDFHDKFKVIDRINTRINEEFRKEKIEIPYPHRVIYMKKEA